MVRLSVLLWIVLLAACKPRGSTGGGAVAAAAPVAVRTATVTERPMPELVTLTGTLRGFQESDVAADAAGKVMQTFVDRGQAVKKGDVLATLDARGAAIGASIAEAQAKVAENQLDQAKRECERVKHLFDTNVISQAEYDRQTSECTSRQWSAAAAQAQQQNATKLLGDTRVRAPFDGVIGERFVNVGQYVAPQNRVVSIYQADPLRLQLTVPEADVALVKPDALVTFTVAAYGEERFKGAIKLVAPNVRELTRDLVCEAFVANPDGRLKPGMFAVVKLSLGQRPRPVVPKSALREDEGGARVFVASGGQAQEHMVQLGEADGDSIAVLRGVAAGDAVVLSPSAELRDGTPLKVE